MSRVGRGRRTRVYDCNYNKGESYYRPVLDRLDGKVPVSREPDREAIRSDVESRIRSALDDIETPHDELFDSRGARAQRGRPLSSAFEDDEFADDVTESLRRLRASKKASRFAEDVDFENSVSNLENRVRISDKILESVGIGHSEVSGARRAFQENEERTEKRIARRLNDDSSLTKWTALKSADDESAAFQRAKATRARLTDLEDEMSELNERSAAREKRAARLRALVGDNDVADTTIAASKVTIRAEREKKQIPDSLRRLRANRQAPRFAEDVDFENSMAKLENRVRISDRMLENVGTGHSEVSGVRRTFKDNEERTEKRISRRSNEDNPLAKWSALQSADDESAAVQRANATRARLTDLEDEMTELNERSAAREKRAARLRALVADSDVADTTIAASKVTIRAEREEKQVT